MTKLLPLVLVCAIAAPASAYAHGSPHKRARPARHGRIAFRNPAGVCKALRAWDRAGFRKAFGTNHNGRNAYGKCVSAGARLRHGARTIVLHGVTVTSTGTVATAGASGCQTSDDGCVVTSTGTLQGIPGTSYTSTWTILWTHASSNGNGGYCAPATGSTTLAVPLLGSITTSDKGTVCEVGATGANVEHTLKDGTFAVSGSTGFLAGTTGSGTLSFDQKPGSSSAAGGAVTASQTFDALKLKLKP